MPQIFRMTCANFFTKYIADTRAKELSPKEKKVALLFSIIIGLLTAWIYHAIVSAARCKLDERVVRLPTDELDPTVFKTQRKGELLHQLKEHGRKATSLDLRSEKYTVAELEEVITLCPNLETMAISIDRVPKRLKRSIKSLTNLKTLDVHLTQDLARDASSQRSLKALQSMDKLKRWSLSHAALKAVEGGLEHPPAQAAEKERVELCLFDKEVTCDEIVEEIVLSPHLRTLSFSVEKLSEALAEQIKKMEKLEELSMTINAVDDSGLPEDLFEQLLKAPNLQTLNLNIPKFNKELSDKIKASQLVSFRLEILNLPRDHLKSIALIVGLKSFYLDLFSWYDKGGTPSNLGTVLTQLKSSQTLENLTLKRCRSIDPNCARILKKFPALVSLELPSLVEIDSRTLEMLKDCLCLKKLVLSNFSPEDCHEKALQALQRKGIDVVTKKKSSKL